MNLVVVAYVKIKGAPHLAGFRKAAENRFTSFIPKTGAMAIAIQPKVMPLAFD